MRKTVLLVLLVVIFTVACHKDERIPEPLKVGELVDTTGPLPALNINFKAVVNGALLQPNTKFYKNSSNDEFTVSKFNYYISNVKLTRTDGVVFTEKESYHLIKHVDGKTSFTINGLPEGTYNRIDFLIGVDSTRNVSGAQTGDLDVAQLMFWDWNSGYIFFKLEGSYISAEVPDQSDYAIHVGGYEAANNCLQPVSFTLNTAIVAKKKRTSRLDFTTNIAEIFNAPVKIGFDYYYSQVVQGPAIFREVSRNYKDMFLVENVSN